MNAGVLFAIGTAFGLGAITTQAKLVYADGGNALTLMVSRFLLSVVVIGLLVAMRRQSFSLGKPTRVPTFYLGFVWCGSMILYLLSIEIISVSIAALILYTYPLMVLLVALSNGQLRPSLALVALFFTAFSGVFLALFSAGFVLNTYGVMLAFMAGCGAAYTFIRGARLAPTCDPFVLTFWVNVVGLVMIIPLVVTQFRLPVSTAGLLLLGSATACYIFAVLCQFQALARLPATTVAFILNLEPVISILLAALILGERLSAPQWFGVLLVLGALYYSTGVISKQAATPR